LPKCSEASSTDYEMCSFIPVSCDWFHLKLKLKLPKIILFFCVLQHLCLRSEKFYSHALSNIKFEFYAHNIPLSASIFFFYIFSSLSEYIFFVFFSYEWILLTFFLS
jgi:hypothetical protein